MTSSDISSPWDRWTRRLGALAVAAVAAYASYQHQRDFALAGGADLTTARLWPLSVDGLLVLSTAGLLRDGRRATGRARYILRAAFAAGIVVSLAANIATAPSMAWAPILVAGWPPVALLLAVELVGHQRHRDAADQAERDDPRQRDKHSPPDHRPRADPPGRDPVSPHSRTGHVGPLPAQAHRRPTSADRCGTGRRRQDEQLRPSGAPEVAAARAAPAHRRYRWSSSRWPAAVTQVRCAGDMTNHLTRAQRALAAKAAADASWANTSDRAARTEPARRAALARFERQVDPNGELPEDERQRRAASARRSYFRLLALRSARARGVA